MSFKLGGRYFNSNHYIAKSFRNYWEEIDSLHLKKDEIVYITIKDTFLFSALRDVDCNGIIINDGKITEIESTYIRDGVLESCDNSLKPLEVEINPLLKQKLGDKRRRIQVRNPYLTYSIPVDGEPLIFVHDFTLDTKSLDREGLLKKIFGFVPKVRIA